MKIINDPEVRQPCSNVRVEEAREIIPKLLETLNELGKQGQLGWGLAAPQIGIFKKVAVITYAGKIITLINPKITDLQNPVVFHNEGCFSLPGVIKNTVRYQEVIFETDTLDEEQGRKTFMVTIDDGMLPYIIQHEIDHLEGILFVDRKQKPIQVELKQGRNDQCRCGSGKKFKKCCLKSKEIEK